MRAVSIVVPALADEALLEGALRSVRAELDHRRADAQNGASSGDPPGDEVLVVDDTGRGQLGPFLRARFPEVRHLGAARNLGFARALTAGLAAARCELVFAMNSDLELEPGCLAPLVAALEDPEVFAAVPRVARADRRGVAGPERVESLVRIRLVGELLRLEQPCLEDPPRHAPDPALGPLPVPFALGGAMLLRRADFEALGGFDPVFEPFYMEDVDLCWRAWRSGRRVLHVPTARARHAGRGTIGARVDPELREAVIGRNLLLLLWKHLDDERALRGHLDRLERGLRAAWVHEQRRELEVLTLALERLDQALASRSLLPAPRRSFARIVEESDPFAAAARLTS